jgi:hypothetical protein
MEALPQALETIFEAQRKRRNEKILKIFKKLSTVPNAFFSFHMDPSYFQTS